jgi:hypothetical protein
MKRIVFVALCAALFVGWAGCGRSPSRGSHPTTIKLPPSVIHACPEATQGHGAMGECAPPEPPSKTATVSSARSGGITYPDRSNNNPTYNMAAVKRAGHPAVVLKVNQGVVFLDHTFYYMALAAKRAGVCVGGYDFDQEYTAAEVYAFIARLHAAGIYRNTQCTLPPTLDVEFGAFNAAGLQHQIDILQRTFGRVNIYTGCWYLTPHLGARWFSGVSAWISGYPFASACPGIPAFRFSQHQYTDHGYDGVGFTDMTRWLGTAKGWAAFTQAGPSQAQIRAEKARSLHAHEHLRAVLHRLIDRHRCRPGQHATPRSYHRVCGRWLREGQAAIKVINRYRREGIR